jgi:phosphoribosylanthranilate isomerase
MAERCRCPYHAAMRRTRIKFCGITRPEDAVDAAMVGADAVGLNFYPGSGRYVNNDQASIILAALPPMVTAIGLFVDAAIETVVETTDRLRLSCAQLHGHESPQFVASLMQQRPTLRIVKAVRVEKPMLSATLTLWRAARHELQLSNFSAVLLETASREAGGSGIFNDWSTVDSAYREAAFESLPPVIAAGGLTPSNVGDIVARYRPWAVDVSTGIEHSRGKKSKAKMAAFADAVRAADAQA